MRNFLQGERIDVSQSLICRSCIAIVVYVPSFTRTAKARRLSSSTRDECLGARCRLASVRFSKCLNRRQTRSCPDRRRTNLQLHDFAALPCSSFINRRSQNPAKAHRLLNTSICCAIHGSSKQIYSWNAGDSFKRGAEGGQQEHEPSRALLHERALSPGNTSFISRRDGLQGQCTIDMRIQMGDMCLNASISWGAGRVSRSSESRTDQDECIAV